LSPIDCLAARQLTAEENGCIGWIWSSILAAGIGPRCCVICIPLPTYTSYGDWGHGGRIGEPANARAAGLSAKGTLAALKLTVEENSGVVRIWPVTLATGIGPRRAIFGVPLSCGGFPAAGTACLTSIGTLAALLLGVVARRVAVGRENTACSTPRGVVVGMPQGGGIISAPGGEELALTLVRLAVDDGDGGFGFFATLVGRRLVPDETAQA